MFPITDTDQSVSAPAENYAASMAFLADEMDHQPTTLAPLERAIPDPRLATICRELGFEKLNCVATEKTYAALNDLLRNKGKEIAANLSGVYVSLDELAKPLAEMQALLSQRGKNRRKVLRDAKLPGWTAWFKNYKEEIKLDVTLRTMQRKIKNLEGPDKGNGNGSGGGKKLALTGKQTERLLAANLCANDMVAAIESGADYTPSMKEFKKLALDADKVTAILETHQAKPQAALSPLESLALGDWHSLLEITYPAAVSVFKPLYASDRNKFIEDLRTYFQTLVNKLTGDDDAPSVKVEFIVHDDHEAFDGSPYLVSMTRRDVEEFAAAGGARLKRVGVL